MSDVKEWQVIVDLMIQSAADGTYSLLRITYTDVLDATLKYFNVDYSSALFN